ncbi:hypothetical protein C8R44DRAFT_889198 [Mycena epipterygia]|nr:hypothetical protein C8R44DRAFT_889198 [Mycena epipterygia]
MFSLACILGAVSATPLASRQAATCNPNFEGAGVSIIDGQTEWGVSPVAAGTPLVNTTSEWHVEQTSLANPTYTIKAISNELVVDVVNGELTSEQLDSTKH